MRRSIFFFTFVLAAMACGSDPETSETGTGEISSETPGFSAPPTTIAIEQLPRYEETTAVGADPGVAARHAASLRVTSTDGSRCASPRSCAEAAERRTP